MKCKVEIIFVQKFVRPINTLKPQLTLKIQMCVAFCIKLKGRGALIFMNENPRSPPPPQSHVMNNVQSLKAILR